MKIKVIGKAHREGVAKKTGNPYNFNQILYIGPDRGVEGLAALTLNLDPSLIPYADIKLNAEYGVGFGSAWLRRELYAGGVLVVPVQPAFDMSRPCSNQGVKRWNCRHRPWCYLFCNTLPLPMPPPFTKRKRRR